MNPYLKLIFWVIALIYSFELGRWYEVKLYQHYMEVDPKPFVIHEGESI